MDNSVWNGQGTEWTSLPEQKKLADVLENQELVKQYQQEFSLKADSRQLPDEYEDLWRCACGTLNRREETACRKCGAILVDMKAVDLTALKEKRDNRLEQERLAREEQARLASEKAAAEKAEREKQEAIQKAKAKKAGKIIAAVLAVAVVGGIIAALTVKVFIPNSKYNAAVQLMENGEYEEAISAFEALDGYKDSEEQIEACKTGIKDKEYDAAVALMESGEYEEAISAFEAMDGYKDSADQITTCQNAIIDGQYADAVALMENGEYEEAISAFEAMDGYKDSDQWIKYGQAKQRMVPGQYDEAYTILSEMGDFEDSEELCAECQSRIVQDKYDSAVQLIQDGSYSAAFEIFDEISGDMDCTEYTDNAEYDVLLQIEQAMYESFDSASQLIQNVSEDAPGLDKWKALIDQYSVYLGNFCENTDDTSVYCFYSDFKLDSSGSVVWMPTFADFASYNLHLSLYGENQAQLRIGPYELSVKNGYHPLAHYSFFASGQSRTFLTGGSILYDLWTIDDIKWHGTQYVSEEFRFVANRIEWSIYESNTATDKGDALATNTFVKVD